ncbi:MAG: hypothetical protein KF764_28595 [Labilithrix sp.]|nr:hypothetical protein [Labilithrix sp.]MBX3220330.1 hypothetical protein [Labilithrix sp.]
MPAESRDIKPRPGLDEPDGAEEEAPGAVESGTIPRETVRPAFDVERYAEDTVGRERLPTITDEVAIEEARIASVLMDSTPPRGRLHSAPEVEVAVRYSEVEALDDEQQLAFLRARLAPMTRVPSLSRKITELGPLIEDPKTAYILGFVDGLLPLETIVEVAGLPELDALRILDRAVDQYVITFRAKPE